MAPGKGLVLGKEIFSRGEDKGRGGLRIKKGNWGNVLYWEETIHIRRKRERTEKSLRTAQGEGN